PFSETGFPVDIIRPLFNIPIVDTPLGSQVIEIAPAYGKRVAFKCKQSAIVRREPCEILRATAKIEPANSRYRTKVPPHLIASTQLKQPSGIPLQCDPEVVADLDQTFALAIELLQKTAR